MPDGLLSEPHAPARNRRNVKLAAWLGVLAALFYIGFIAMNWHGGG